jgi:hypothetical protein
MSSNHTSTRTDQPEECGDGSSKPKKWYTNDKKTSIEVLRCNGFSTEFNGFYHYSISFVPPYLGRMDIPNREIAKKPPIRNPKATRRRKLVSRLYTPRRATTIA